MRVSTTVQRWPSVSTLVPAPNPTVSTSPSRETSSASGPISGSRHGVPVLPSPVIVAEAVASASALRSAPSTSRAAASLKITARQ